jgi:hypothetical protein
MVKSIYEAAAVLNIGKPASIAEINSMYKALLFQ